MAAGNTTDTRTHVMGDMLMMTGTFTDGGIDVSFGGILSTVFAAGGHLTSVTATPVLAAEAEAAATGSTELTVDTADARLHFNIGDTVYHTDGRRYGVITALTATAITFGGGLLVAVANDVVLCRLGARKAGVTLLQNAIEVSIDETNQFVVFEAGSQTAIQTTNAADGRWWILGQR